MEKFNFDSGVFGQDLDSMQVPINTMIMMAINLTPEINDPTRQTHDGRIMNLDQAIQLNHLDSNISFIQPYYPNEFN